MGTQCSGNGGTRHDGIEYMKQWSPIQSESSHSVCEKSLTYRFPKYLGQLSELYKWLNHSATSGTACDRGLI